MRRTAALLLPLWLLAGCATSDRDTYSAQDVGRVMETTRGTVVASREVRIRSENSGVGAAIGGASGGIVAGTTIGAGDGSVIAGVLGGLLGMAVGYMAEEAFRGGDGVEYTIETDDGRTVTVVQNNEDQPIAAGTPVMVQWGGEYSRVVPLRQAGVAAGGPAPEPYPSSSRPVSSPMGAPPRGAPTSTTSGPSSAPASDEWVNPDTLPAAQQQPASGYDTDADAAAPWEPDEQPPAGAPAF